jgi:hypothetical protein
VVEAGHALDEVRQHLGAQPSLMKAGQQLPGPLPRVRRPAAADVLHAVEDDAGRAYPHYAEQPDGHLMIFAGLAPVP